MRNSFNFILLTLFLATSPTLGLTLPEAAEKRQCLGTNTNCFLTNPGACCSCGFDSAFGSGCTNTPCSIQQEEGILPGLGNE
ncbi:hypothetical protein R3P38DRAFT_3237314 [Favolaschia claudopus]|uniref:Uncharacterized protein n=1 Tax=Favolaschia claudopus TaxID=2862362 RepID=A0AAV9ZC27_9AGAR